MDPEPRTVVDVAERRKNRQQRPIPPEWETILLDKGFEYRGKASATALASKAGVSPTATLRVIHRDPVDPETVAMVGRALGEPAWVAAWVNMPAPRSFTLPAEAEYLDSTQRELVEQLVRVFARDRMEVDGHGVPSQKKRAAVDGSTEPPAGSTVNVKKSPSETPVGNETTEQGTTVSDSTYSGHSVTSGRGGRGSRQSSKAGKQHGRKGNAGS